MVKFKNFALDFDNFEGLSFISILVYEYVRPIIIIKAYQLSLLKRLTAYAS